MIRQGSRVYLNPQEIFDVALERVDEYAERDARYRRHLRYYFGESPISAPEVRAMDDRGMPLLRYVGDWSMDEGAMANKVMPIVDDYQSIIGRMPRKKVDPPDPSPAGRNKAELLTKYLYSTDDLCDMPLQQMEAGFFASDLGDAVYVLEVIPEKRRVAISSICPLFCYPSFKRGWERFELYDLVIVTAENPDDLKRDYGYAPRNDSPEECLLITYISPWQKTVLVGIKNEGPQETVAHINHNLGFCHARWHYNKYTKGRQANADIAGILGLQDFYNQSMKIAQDGLVEMTYPVRMIKNPIGEDNQIEVGPGSTIQVDEMGDIKTEAPTPPPQAAQMLMDIAQGDMMMTAGQAPVRQEGQLQGSIQTGKAIHAAQGPQATRVDLRQAAMAYTHSRLYAQVLQMQEKAPFLKDQEIEIYGRYKNATFRQTMNTHDIEGWYQVTISWEQLMGMTRAARVQMAMEGMAAEMWDDEYAMDIAGVDDPAQMREAVENWKRRKAKTQIEIMQMEQGAQGQPGGAPGGGPGGMQPKPNVPGVSFQQQPGAQGGGQPPPSPPSMTFRPAQGGAPPSKPPIAGLPKGVTLTVIENALRAVADKLQGTVWAVGDLARTGQALRPQLRISNFKDYRWVRQALDPIAPNAEIKHEKSEEAMGAFKERVA